jgi:hypothetical protein
MTAIDLWQAYLVLTACSLPWLLDLSIHFALSNQE